MALPCSAWEAVCSATLLTCKSTGHSCTLVLLCSLSFFFYVSVYISASSFPRSSLSSPVESTAEPVLGGRVSSKGRRMEGAQESSTGATVSPTAFLSFYPLTYLHTHPRPSSVSLPMTLSPSCAADHKDKAEWRKTVPSYNQSAGAMDLRVWNTQDESQEPLPKNWEMAYTETGMVYFIE